MHDGADSGPGTPLHSIPMLRWAAFTLFAVLGTASLWLSGPQVEADEGSYLLSAAMLAGLTDTNPATGYYSGYSLLLIPAFLLQSQPERIYHLVLLLNALLVASTPFALYRLTRLLWPQIELRAHAVAAIVAVCYAPVLMLSQHAMSENALVPLYAWMLASAAVLVLRERATAGFAFGAIAGFLFLVHPRGATMAAPVLLIATIFSLAHRRCRRGIAIAWIVASATASLHWPLEQLAGRTSSGGGYSLHATLAQLATPSGWGWLFANLIGATTEAVVASFGLFAVAVRLLYQELRPSRSHAGRPLTARTAVLLACAAGMGTALLVTAAFFVPPGRADMLSYGRYALPTLIPLLAFGVIRLQADRAQRLRDFAFSLGAGLVGIAGTAIAFKHLPAAATENWNFINSITLYLATRYVPFDTWGAIAICFVAAMILIGAALRHSPYKALMLYATLNAAIFAITWLTITLPGSRYYASDRHVVEIAWAFAATGGSPLCIGFNAGVDAWHRPDLGWRLSPQLAHPDRKDCIAAKIQPISAQPPPHMRLAAIERPSPLPNGTPIGLFVRDGPELDAFSRSHSLPPATALARLPPEDRHADVHIDLLPASILVLAAGETLDLHLRITNRGRSVLATGALQLLPYPILAGAYVSSGTVAQWNYRAELPRPISPGESAEVKLRIGPIPHPGNYTMHAGLVQEHVAWFDGGVDTMLTVTP